MTSLNAPREALRRVANGLPAHWYRDPDHHERELEAFWYGRWIAIARMEEIPREGDYRVVALGNQSIVVLRGADGAPRAFHNTCRHRGSILCTEDTGHFKGGHITCPYHAWTYNLDGHLAATPRRMPTRDFNPENFQLFEVAAEQWGGFVFINLSPGKPRPLLKTLGELPNRFLRYGFADLRIGHRIVADVNANWKLLAENFSECFHCPPVHPELCRVVTAYQEGGAWGLRGNTEQRPEYRNGVKTLTLDGSARIPPFRALNETEKNTPYIPWMAPPNLFLNVHPDYVNAHMMFPTGPTSVRIIYDWLFEPDHMPKGADLDHYVALWDVTNRQDARNCEWQQRGMQSRAFKHGVFVPQEFDCARFAQWVSAGLKASKSR
jgi:glycine betaine catabolism A